MSDIPPDIGTLHGLESSCAKQKLDYSLPDNHQPAFSGLPLRQERAADQISLGTPPPVSPNPAPATPQPSQPTRDRDALDALAWIERGMPDSKVNHGPDAPQLTPEQLQEFEPASYVPGPVLMMLPENPGGHKLEDLLAAVARDLVAKSGKAQFSEQGPVGAEMVTAFLRSQNQAIIELLHQARSIQVTTLRTLDMWRPLPDGKTRI